MPFSGGEAHKYVAYLAVKLDCAIIHTYKHDSAVFADPGNWDVPSYVAKDFAEMFVNERAKIAKALNKPFILEETGKDVSPSLYSTSITSGCFACLEAGDCKSVGSAKTGTLFSCAC